MFFSFWCSLAMSNFPAHPPSYPRPCYHPQKPKPFPLFIKKNNINIYQHYQPSTPSTPWTFPFNKKNSPAPLWIGPRNSWLVLCHVFWQSSGRSRSPDAGCQLLRLLGPSISWENKPCFGLDMLDILVEDGLLTFLCECLKVWGHIFMEPCRKG